MPHQSLGYFRTIIITRLSGFPPFHLSHDKAVPILRVCGSLSISKKPAVNVLNVIAFSVSGTYFIKHFHHFQLCIRTSADLYL